MIEVATLIISVITAVLVLFLCVWLSRRHARLEAPFPLARERFIQQIRAIRPGLRREDVARRLGVAGGPRRREWIYYISDESGFAIEFDTEDRVERVSVWVA